MPEIVLSHIGKVFPGTEQVTALEDIDLTVADNEFVCILGPSGCGKSTLLEIIAGLQVPTAGEVRVGGEPVQGPGRDIGVVFQDPSLFPWRTVRQNVRLGPELAGTAKEKDADIQHYLDLVKLTGFERKYPHQLSGGMRQRAGLARTLVNDPKVLVMDEPFAGLDHLTRLKLQEDLVEIWQRELKTVVFVTHDVHEAVFLGDRVVLLAARPGRVQEVFEVGVPRERRRTDSATIAVQDAIYHAIYASKQGEIEYAL